jgi:hypothetical protein
MGHKSITVALFFGMLALPLACGGDDDDTVASGGKGGKSSGGKSSGGKGGSAGKAGASGKGGGAGTGTGGKGGGAGTGTGGTNAGTGGTSAGTGGTNAGTGGTNAGTGGTNAGTGGGAGDQGGAGQGGAGEGGGGTGGETPEQHRQALCAHICSAPIVEGGSAGAGGMGEPTSCGQETECVAELCDTTGMDAVCLTATTDYLECVDAWGTDGLYCSPWVKTDFVGFYQCTTAFYAWAACT